MQIFHLKQCNEVEDGRVNIIFHAARDAREVFVNVFSQTIKATPLHQFTTHACEFRRKRRGVDAHTHTHTHTHTQINTNMDINTLYTVKYLDFYDVSYKTFYK